MEPVILNESFERSEVKRLLAKFYKVRGNDDSVIIASRYSIKFTKLNYLVFTIHSNNT